MKGVSFQKPLELRIEIQGESWRQGDKVAGVLTVKNSGGGTSQEEVVVHLAHRRSKRPFTVVASAKTTGDRLEWSFDLDPCCQVTSGSESLYVIYGRAAGALDTFGLLQLNVAPVGTIDEFIDVLTTQFRFVRKSARSSKGWVETKFGPPSSKSFAMLEGLVLSARVIGDVLELKYDFQIKKVDAASKAFEQSLRRDQYRLPSGRFNHESVEAAIREVLTQVESKVVF